MEVNGKISRMESREQILVLERLLRKVGRGILSFPRVQMKVNNAF